MADILDNLMKKRRYARSSETRLINKLNELVLEGNLETLELNVEKLQDRKAELLKLNGLIHDILQGDEYERDAEECEERDDVGRECLYKALKGIEVRKLQSIPTLSNTTMTGESTIPISTSLVQTRLPTVDIKPFDGRVENWQRFWDQFSSSIDGNVRLSVIDKHIYLRTLLRDSALAMVDGMELSAGNYETVKKKLQERYGDKDTIIQAHIDFIEDLKPKINPSATELKEMYELIQVRINALEALGEPLETLGRSLSKRILRLFPQAICEGWIRYTHSKEIRSSNLTELIRYLEREINTIYKASELMKTKEDDEDYGPTPSAAALAIATEPKVRTHFSLANHNKPLPFCVFCEKKGHWGQDCRTVTDPEQRKQKLRSDNRCFLCMSKGHNGRTCCRKDRLKCRKCMRNHHTAICNSKRDMTKHDLREGDNNVIVNTITSQVTEQNSEEIFLQTAKVRVKMRNGTERVVRCILDPGSHRSFVNTKLIEDIQAHYTAEEKLTIKPFETNEITSKPRRKLKFTMFSMIHGNAVTIEALESYNKYISFPSVPVAMQRKFHNLKFADIKIGKENLPVEILIGSDYYWSIVQSETIRLSDKLVLVKTKLGWILNGPIVGARTSIIETLHVAICSEDQSTDQLIRNLWETEAMGIREEETKISHHSLTNQEVLETFAAKFKIEDGRGVVSLPWKDKVEYLTDNFPVARERFSQLKNRLNQNRQLKSQYIASMENYYKNEQIEKVDGNPDTNTKVFYLPHRAVIQEKRETTKVRIVFDGSAHEQNELPLNAVLETGPNMNPEAMAVLLRFRTYALALCGDGSQAFLQLSLAVEDRDATRFFWFDIQEEPDGSVRTTDKEMIYRFARLPFGLNCSPFLLAAAIREVAKRCDQDQYSAVTPLINEGFYVDDFTAGADTDYEILEIYHQLTALTNRINLPMQKWTSNSGILNDELEKQGNEVRKMTKVLGVGWEVSPDTLFISNCNVVETIDKHPDTKKHLLTTTAQVYDPLGLVSPVTVIGKILFQETWKRGLAWNELLPADLMRKWTIWKKDIKLISSIAVPRWLGVKSKQTCQIHIFCDASEHAYGAVVYLRVNREGQYKITMVMSKNRLAPIKPITLPRLELLGALVGARLLRYVLSETRLQCSSITMWTDSTIVLAWIQSNTQTWKTFVANRVVEIQEKTQPSTWRHCPGDENPADLLTRGVPLDELKQNELWWKGPTWLREEEKGWPDRRSKQVNQDQLQVEQRTITVHLTVQSREEEVFPVERINNYSKVLRITAWILRFVNSCRGVRPSATTLTAEEMQQSELAWLKMTQRTHFAEEIHALKNNQKMPRKSQVKQYNPSLNSDGLLCIQGRLHFSIIGEREKHPVILEGNHPFTRLMIRHEHRRLYHMGTRMVLTELRNRYWIQHGRQAINKELKKCLICKRWNSKAGNQIEAPLPADRVTPSKPFQVTGLDFAGPIYIRRGTTAIKSYLVLFTCAVTRAIHLELVTRMTTERFLFALQRFFGRRGVSETIYSDNAKTFKAANNELGHLWTSIDGEKTASYFAHHGVRWKFIVERAAWWGGWWERMIQTIKRCLKKTLGNSQLDEEEMNTLLIGVEATVNSRPITYVYNSNTEPEEPLTPAHFLVGNRLTKMPYDNRTSTETDLNKLWRKRNQLLESFWKRWQHEYLMDLENYHRVKIPQPARELDKGDVVLVKDDYLPRQFWKTARVDTVQPGRDGKIRSCMLKTSTGQEIRRPVQLLYPLEI